MISKLTIKNYLLKKEKEYLLQKRGEFLYYYWSLFKSIKEGDKLTGLKRSIFYYRSHGNQDKKAKEERLKKG